MNRWPRERLPLLMPFSSKSTTAPPQRAEDPVDGPREPDVLVHPAHGLRERDGQNEPGQRLLEPGGRIAALFIDPGNHVFALVRGLGRQRLDRHPVLLGKNHCRFRGLALGVKGDLLRGADNFFRDIGLAFIHIGNVQDKPSRRADKPSCRRDEATRPEARSAANSSFIFSSAGSMNREGISSVADL